MIEVDIRSKRFDEVLVLKDVRFGIAKGETVALVGPSGIGKTTLLRILCGIDGDFDGSVTRPPNQAIVLQEPTLLPWRSVLDNLRIVHPSLARPQALQMLDRVGLEGKAALFPGQLSLGQQRRLSLARAFAGAPDLLIMDEPFASLDAETADRMIALTARLIAETRPATLLVTHDPREAETLADRILTLVPQPDGATLSG